jgi:hypothetical protein
LSTSPERKKERKDLLTESISTVILPGIQVKVRSSCVFDWV